MQHVVPSCVFIFFLKQCKLLTVISDRKKWHPFVRVFIVQKILPTFHEYVEEVPNQGFSERSKWPHMEGGAHKG
jgi:hypothetical protein